MRGIYSIRNKVTGDQYIGSSIDIETRWKDHRWWLIRDRWSEVGSPHLQNSWNTYGERTFEFKCIDEVEEGRDLLEAEQWWLDIFWPTGYNTNPTAGCGPGIPRGTKLRPRTEEEKEHLRRINQGKPGTPHTDETREKIRRGREGQPGSFKGKHHTEESKEKIRQSLLGKSRSPESVEKSRRALLGKTRPPSVREAIREGWVRRKSRKVGVEVDQ